MTSLTKAQKRVLSLLVTGASNNEIAMQLGLKECTVKSHTSSILKKFGVKSRTEALLELVATTFMDVQSNQPKVQLVSSGQLPVGNQNVAI